jgi:thioredoxin-related protein
MRIAFFLIMSAFTLTCLPDFSFAQKKSKEKSQTVTEKIHWYSFEEAYQLNKKKQKKIFIDVFTDWCGWCKKMDAETFTNPVISEYMMTHFYCVKLNAERKDTIIIDGVTFTNPNPYGHRSTHQLAIELLKGNMSYPSYVFLNEKSQWLTVVPGYQGAKDFEPILHYFGENAYQKTPWEDFRSTFTGEIR